MVTLINRTQRAIFFGRTMLVPARPTEVDDLTIIQQAYPAIADAITAGKIEKMADEKTVTKEKEVVEEEKEVSEKGEKVAKKRTADSGV